MENPFDRILEQYEDYKYVNDKLLENFQPNNDYSLDFLKRRGTAIEASIHAITYAKTYVESGDVTVPEPPWNIKED